MTIAKKSREANLDLLRIVSMLLIIFLHSIDHSGVLENAENCGTGIYFWVQLTYALCMVCVNIYVMLSGYFMVNSKFRLHKLLTLWIEAVFYSFALKLVFMLTGTEAFSLVSLASCFVPILTGRYWFLTIYVGLYLISPFINLLIRAVNKKQHGLLNSALFVIMSLWASIHPAIAGMNSGGGWGLAWFVVLYLVAAWLRLYHAPARKTWLYFLVFLGIASVMAFLRTVLAGGAFVPLGNTLAAIVKNWYRYDSAPVYIMTVCLFMGFLNIQIRSSWLSSVITAVAPLTLGVYLIHAHANVSPWSWAVLNLPAKMDSALFPLIQLACVIGIFTICISIDAARKATVGRLENAPFLKNLCDRVQAKIQSFIDRFSRSNI